MSETDWERLRDLVAAQARGDAPVRISSKRTLFGIPSSVETAIETIVKEHEESQRDLRSTIDSDQNT